MGITKGEKPEMWCHWWMPFRKYAKISLRNPSEQRIRIYGSVQVAPYQWNERSMLFHAKWRIQRNLPARPFIDWTHLHCWGKGRFVGGGLCLVNLVPVWWGEGDEKIYVDGEEFPSHFGTGSEDYYGYAWGCPALFEHAYHNQTRCDGPRNYGYNCVNRFHIFDDIPFTREFKFDMENWHKDPATKVFRSAISYWYAQPGGTDFFKPPSHRDLQPIEVPEFEIPFVAGAIEAERMKVVNSAGSASPAHADLRYSGAKQLLWHGARVGDKLALEFDTKQAVKKQLVIRLTKAAHSPKVQCYFNGRKVGKVINLYSERTVPTKQINLGMMDFQKGPNRLSIEIVEGTGDPQEKYAVGVDYIIIK